MIVLVPLVTGTAMLNTTGKVAAFEILGAILLMLVLTQANLESIAGRIKQYILIGPNLPIVLYVLVAIISCIFATYRSYATAETLRIGFCALVYFVMAYHIRGKEHLYTITNALLFVTVIISLYSLASMTSRQIDSSNAFGSHELVGSYLMLVLPIMLALGLIKRGDAWRELAAQGVALLAAVCLMMTQTRSAWLGGASSLIALSILAYRYQHVNMQPGTSRRMGQLRSRKHLVIGPVALLIGSIVLLIALTATGGILGHRASTITNPLEDESLQTRIAIWKDALKMFLAHPIFGAGVGTYPVLEFWWSGRGDFTSHVLAHGTSHSNIAHEFYLQTAAELGIVGLGLYIAVIVGFFRYTVGALYSMENGLRKTILIGCIAAIVGQVIDAFGSPSYNFASVSLFQWIIMGLGISCAGTSSMKRAQQVAVKKKVYGQFG